MAEEGSAEYEIVAKIVYENDEASLEAAKAQAAEATGRDASPVSERPRRGKESVDVDAKITAKIDNLAKLAQSVQDALHEGYIDLQIEPGSIRKQIELQLRAPFSITVNADIQGAERIAGAGTQHSQATISGAPVGRGAPPQELEGSMFRTGKKGRELQPFASAIDSLYRNINDAFEQAGKGRFGAQPIEPGNRIEKAAELLEAFGSDVKGWMETAGPLGVPTGGGSVMAALKELGVGPEHPIGMAAATSIGGFGGDNRRSQEIFFSRLNKWVESTPATPQPAAASEPQAREAAPRPQATVDPSIHKIIAAAEEQTKVAREAVIQERQQSLAFTPVGPETTAPFVAGAFKRRGEGSGGPLNVDLEADARARQQLGDDRANVRRLRGRGGSLGGIELEPFLRAAESGAFQDVFERFEPGQKGVSQGLVKATSGTDEGFDELSRLGKRRPGVRFDIAGQEGRFAAVRPAEALERAFAEATGAPDAARDFLNQPENRESIRLATAQGSRPKVGVPRGTKGTRRGQGGPTIQGARLPRPGGVLDDIAQAEVIRTSDSSEYAEASARFSQLQAHRKQLVAQRRDLQERIDAANEEEEQKRTETPGKKTTRAAYRRMTKLGRADEALTGELAENSAEMKTLRSRYPQLRDRREREGAALRARDAADRARSGPAQREIERGRSAPRAGDEEFVGGRTAAEREVAHIKSPEAQGAIGAHLMTALGLGDAASGMSPTKMVQSALMQRYLADQSRVSPTGESLTGRQAMRRAAYGPTTRARRTINENEDAGVYGELVQAIPGDLPQSSRQTLTRAISDLLSSALEDDKFKRDAAEKAIQAKEGLTRGVRPARTTKSAMVDERAHAEFDEFGIDRGPGPVESLSFDRPQTGEGLFLDPPGTRGGAEGLSDLNRRRRAVAERYGRRYGVGFKESIARVVPEGSEYPYPSSPSYDPDAPQDRGAVERHLMEREAQDRTRQSTLGRGRTQSGDDVTKLAREAGIPMESDAAPTELPFAAFSAKYGGQPPPGSRPPAPPGDGPGDRFSEISGPIHVIVDNVPLAVTFADGEVAPRQGRGPGDETATGEGTETYKPAEFPADRKIGAVERAMERDFVAALQGQNDPRAREAFEKRSYDRDKQYLSGSSPTPAERDFLAALQAANKPQGGGTARLGAREAAPLAVGEGFDRQFAGRDPLGTRRGRQPLRVKRTPQDIALEREQRAKERQEAEDTKLAAARAEAPFQVASKAAQVQEKQAREADRAQKAAAAAAARQAAQDRRLARISNPAGVDFERNEGQDELAPERGTLRSTQRRVPRRGFGASLTDLVTSKVGGKAFEKQLELAGRAETEFADLQSLTNKRADLRAQRTDLTGQRQGASAGRQKAIDEQIVSLNKQIKGLDTAIDLTKTRFHGFAGEAGKASTVLKSFSAAAVGATVAGVASLATFAVGGAFSAGVSLAVINGLEKILGDPGLKGQVRTSLGEGTRAAGGRSEVAVAQQFAQAGLADTTARRIAPDLERVAAIEAGNKALEAQIGLIKVAEEARGRGADAGVTQTLNGILGTFINGTMPAAEQLGNFIGGAGASVQDQRQQSLIAQGGRAREYASRQVAQGNLLGGDVELIGNVEKFRDRLGQVNEFLGKAEGNLIRFAEGTEFARDALLKQADELERLGAPRELVSQVRSQLVGITNGEGQLATGGEALSGIGEALVQASKPTIDSLLRQTADERRAQVILQDKQRQLSIGTIQPQQTAIGLAAQGLGTGTPVTAAAGIDTGGLKAKDVQSLNKELANTQLLYDQINNEVDLGVKAAKEFVATTFSYDPSVGQDFAKSLDLAAGYGREIASIQIGVQTKQAAFQAEQFSYQISIAKRNLADAKGLVSGVGSSLGAIERQLYNLQRQSQALGLSQSQHQINFQRSIAGFTAPGLTGEERAARIKQAKIEADFAQKQLDIQKKIFGLSGKQFDVQAARQVTDLINQIGLLEKGRVITLETAAAEKRIKVLTQLQANENKKVEDFYNAAIARTNDILTLEAQLVASTGAALIKVTDAAINAFRRTYAAITTTVSGGNFGSNYNGTPNSSGSPDDRNALGAVGMVNGATSFGSIGIAGEAGGEAYAILRDPQKLMSPMNAGSGQTTIQIVVSGNKFTSEEEESRMLRKITQAVQDAQGRDLALRGLRTP